MQHILEKQPKLNSNTLSNVTFMDKAKPEILYNNIRMMFNDFT